MGARWLFKTEPGAYAFDDLEREGRTVWDGVRNPLALKHLREVEKGDRVLVYHTGSQKAVVGIATVARAPYPDRQAADPRGVVVDLTPLRRLARAVPLSEMKTAPKLKGFDLLRLPRLSVMPVSPAHWDEILRLAAIAR